MTTIDLIKMLPIDDDTKQQVINAYPGMSAAEKLEVDRMAWTTFDAMREATIQENLGIQYEKVKKGEEKFGEGFYERAVKKSDQEITEQMNKDQSKFDLEAARKAMEIIVREIQASKIKIRQ